MNSIKKLSFAKINLGLQVLNKRADGYHNINTVFYLTKLADILTFKKTSIKDLNISSNVDFGIPKEDNLIYKAIEKFAKKFPLDFGVDVHIEKNIPMGGGLGGGSSNAAITLNAINELSGSRASYNDLLIIAQSLGSDIPYFLKYGTAVAGSRGESLAYFDYELPYSIVIVNPNIHIGTPEAYRKLSRTEKERQKIHLPMVLINADGNATLFKEFLINDFEEVVLKDYPEIEEIKAKLYSLGADFTLLSGSGASVFGLFPKDYKKEEIKSIFPNYFVWCQ